MQDDFMKSECIIDELQTKTKTSSKPLTNSIQNDNNMFAVTDTYLIQSLENNIHQIFGSFIIICYQHRYLQAEIAHIIRSTISAFFPDVDVSNIQLPAESCAGYMRREELWTVSTAHQASFFFQSDRSRKIFRFEHRWNY